MHSHPLLPSISATVLGTVARVLSWFALAACHSGATDGLTTLDDAQLTISQIGLNGRSIGEAALLTGPDGTTVLIDVGNDGHHEDIVAVTGSEHVDHIVLTHDHSDHVDGLPGFTADHLWTWEQQELPVVVDLGEGAELTLFKADGRLATADGMVDLWQTLGDPGREENPRSVVGIVRWGAFSYLFAGDLTGGGKGTLDVESALVAQADRLPWVPPEGVTALHVSHHGISSSTNAAWADWLRPQLAVVGANGAYLDAPSPEALSALAPHVTRVYVTEDGLLGNADERTVIAHGTVTLQVGAHGDRVGVKLDSQE